MSVHGLSRLPFNPLSDTQTDGRRQTQRTVLDKLAQRKRPPCPSVFYCVRPFLNSELAWPDSSARQRPTKGSTPPVRGYVRCTRLRLEHRLSGWLPLSVLRKVFVKSTSRTTVGASFLRRFRTLTAPVKACRQSARYFIAVAAAVQRPAIAPRS